MWKPGGRELFFDLMNVSTPNNKVPFFLCLSSALEMLHGGIIRQAVKLFYNKPGGTVQKSTVSRIGTLGIIIFYIFEPPAVQKYSICWVFHFVIYAVFVYLTVQNIMFKVLGHLAFQKYNTFWVFLALHHRLYLCICEFVFVYLCIWC